LEGECVGASWISAQPIELLAACYARGRVGALKAAEDLREGEEPNDW
jgi:hypothetical protein